MRKKFLGLFGAMVMTCAMFTACGSSADTSSSAESVTVEDEDVTTTAEDTSANAEDGDYVVGTKDDFQLQELGDTELAITKYLGDAEYVTIPDSISGRPIVKISGFHGNDSLNGIIIPDTVTKIDEKAFLGLENLETVVLGNGVETIGEEAFMICDNLKTINFPDTITCIGEDAFNCNSMEEIHIPLGINIINAGAFCNGNWEELIIPSNVKSIGREGFAANDNLKVVYIEEGGRRNWI